MKKISLTDEQRTNLLEMCRDIFPEFTNIRFGKGWERDNLWLDAIPHTLPDPIQIHWFELCLRYLPSRMQENFNVTDGAYFDLDILDDCNSDDVNPVDTLYNEYKKLKNESVR